MNFWGFQCVCCECTLAVGNWGLCSRCRQRVSTSDYCGRCGSPLPQPAAVCGNCLNNPPHWDNMVIIGRYTEPLSGLIHRFKFQQQYWLDHALAQLLLLAVRAAKRTHGITLPQVILPVPLHRRRQGQRGYNQADLLAQRLATPLNLPYRNDLLQRVRHTHSQRGLNAATRRQNLKNAFTLNPNIAAYGYHSVALVDDVITTGTTLNEAAKLLRQAGVAKIQVWGLARV